jgi:hypothetical protein
MVSHDDFVEQCLDPSKRPLDRNRGLQADSFSEALKRSSGDSYMKEGVPRTPGTDIADPYGSQVKPKDVPVWTKTPVSPEEEMAYYGLHIHDESNPLGLHSHVMGGKPSGGHSHGPQNRFGSHTHKESGYGIVDGSHTHEAAVNMPCGPHNHCPENFG